MGERILQMMRDLGEAIRRCLTHLRHLTHLTSHTHHRTEGGFASVPVGHHSPDVARRVRRGASILDEKSPGWEESINPMELRIESAHNCVLGQRFGHYGHGLSILNIDDWDAGEYGFNTLHHYEHGVKWHDFRMLNREWHNEIALRRARV